jgi:purine nucleoside phosphorylase
VTDTLGLIVGSGFDALGLEVVARSPTKTPYGEPSSPVLTVRIGERRIACIARHGERHAIAPHEINYRANLWALHERGVRTCIGVNAVGAIAAGFRPGDLAVPDQLIDYTYGRAATFGGEGTVGRETAPAFAALPPSMAVGRETAPAFAALPPSMAVGRETAPASAALPPSMAVVHVEFTEPFDPALRGRLAAAVADCGYGTRGGTYGVTQGPRLETAAEILRLERDGCAMVGMTAMPEAVLARELGWAYAICAVAVNYAAGRSPVAAPIMAEIAASLGAGMRRVGEVLVRVTSSPTGDAM